MGVGRLALLFDDLLGRADGHWDGDDLAKRNAGRAKRARGSMDARDTE
jgi:hypothetical protein